jgi:hypothetical protein
VYTHNPGLCVQLVGYMWNIPYGLLHKILTFLHEATHEEYKHVAVFSCKLYLAGCSSKTSVKGLCVCHEGV